MQSSGKVRVADEVPAIQQTIVRLHRFPRVLVVEPAGGEERRVTKDIPEGGQIDRTQAPGLEELLLLLRGEHLLVSLIAVG